VCGDVSVAVRSNPYHIRMAEKSAKVGQKVGRNCPDL
jgi:hypothetical protein